MLPLNLLTYWKKQYVTGMWNPFDIAEKNKANDRWLRALVIILTLLCGNKNSGVHFLVKCAAFGIKQKKIESEISEIMEEATEIFYISIISSEPLRICGFIERFKKEKGNLFRLQVEVVINSRKCICWLSSDF